MRLLFLHTALGGKTSEYTVHTTLAEQSRAAGIESTFIWQPAAHGPPMYVPTAPNRLIVHDFGRDLTITPRPDRIRRAQMMLTRLPGAFRVMDTTIRAIKPDFLYTTQQRYDVRWGQIMSRRHGVPHIIHIHYSVGRWLGLVTMNAIRRSGHLITVSDFVRHTAILNGAAAATTFTLPNSITAPTAAETALDRTAARAAVGVAPDAPLIIAVGRLDPSKGHELLFNALSRVVTALPDVRLLLCGTSTTREDYEPVLRQRVSALGLDRQVIFAGQRQDVAALLASADVFCLPTELEPFGLVFLEAMAAGLPVVACLSGAVPEVVADDITGFLSYPGDVETLATNLTRVLADNALRERMGQAARQRLQDHFTPEHIAQRWVKILHQMRG